VDVANNGRLMGDKTEFGDRQKMQAIQRMEFYGTDKQ